MAWNADNPALANTIADDIPDIEENFQCLNDRFAYDLLWIPAGALVPFETNGPEHGILTTGATIKTLEYYAFSSTTEEYVNVCVPMPLDWNLGTIKAKFAWTGASGCTAGDTVEWQLNALAVSNDDLLTAAVGTQQVISDTVLAGVNADLHWSDATPAITIGGTPALGDLIIFQASRNVSGTDDMAEDAYLFGILIQYARTNAAVSAW